MIVAQSRPIIDLRGVELMPRAGADSDSRTQQDVNGFEEVCPRTKISSLRCQSLRHVLGGKAQSLPDVRVHIGSDLLREQLLPLAVLAKKPDSAQDSENLVCVRAIRRTLIERTKTRAQPIDPVALGLCKQSELDTAVQAAARKKAAEGSVMSDDERRKLVSTEQSLGMTPEARVPSGFEVFGGDQDEDKRTAADFSDADSFFNLPDAGDDEDEDDDDPHR